jgi:NADH-quinone oxidoreductase subunit C
MAELEKENKIAQQINNTFHSAEIKIQRERRVIVNLRNDLIPPFLGYAKDYLGFVHLSHYSCVDWIEENQFELVFILWNYDEGIQIIAKTRIDRTEPKFVTIRHLWPQAETYEREFHEMYGIDFEGNDRLGEFILEDWDDMPPMRRDFDTVKYAGEHYYKRPGREDAQDVRETISKHSGEEIPDFAKDYSIRQREE